MTDTGVGSAPDDPAYIRPGDGNFPLRTVASTVPGWEGSAAVVLNLVLLGVAVAQAPVDRLSPWYALGSLVSSPKGNCAH